MKAFRNASFIELLILLAVLGGLCWLYSPLRQAAGQNDQRFVQEVGRLAPFARAIELGNSAGKLLPSLCDSIGQHLREASRRRFCGNDERLGDQPLPKQLAAADTPSVAALATRQDVVQAYIKQRLAELRKHRRSEQLRAEQPDEATPQQQQAEQAFDALRQQINLGGNAQGDEPWQDLRCAYRQWGQAYGRSSEPSERAEILFTLAALLDAVELKTVPSAVFRQRAEGCQASIQKEDIQRISDGLQAVCDAQAGLPKAVAMRDLARQAAWRFAAMALLAWLLLLLGRVSDAPLRILALALPLWAGVGLGLGVVSWHWLLAAGMCSLLCLRVPLAAQAQAIGVRRAPASVWAYPLVVLLMGLGFWLLIDQSLFFLEIKRFLALYHQGDVWLAFALISCLPLAAPWLLGLAMAFNHWLLAAQHTGWLAVLLRFGIAAALVLSVVVLAGRNSAFTSDWLKSWLILTSAGVFLTRGDAIAKLAGRFSLKQMLGVLLPLLLVAGIAVAGLLKTKDMGPLVVIVLAGAALVGAIVMAAMYGAGGLAQVMLAWLGGCVAALAWVAVVVGGMFTLGGLLSQWLPHVGERLEAVADPYSSHNDQMAVVGMFREKVPDFGFGLGETPWCGYGVKCLGLPKQLASDYTATALHGAFGLRCTLLLLLAIGCVLFAVVRAHALAPQPAINAPDRWRSYAGWLALLWALVILAQTVMTLFGNFGRLPLSGITLPFVSYGTVSLLANAFFFGLVLNVCRPPAALAAPAAGRSTLRVSVLAVLLPVLAVVLSGLSWAARQATEESAPSRHHDKRLYAAAKTLEKAIQPNTAATKMEWTGPCQQAFSKTAAQQQLDLYGRIIQYRLDELAVPGSKTRNVFDAQAWAKQVELGVSQHDFECADALRALDHLADGQTISKLDWRGRTPNNRNIQPGLQVAVPTTLFDRRDPWITANGCVVWGSGGQTVYQPSSGHIGRSKDRCAELAQRDSGASVAQAVWDETNQDDPQAASWTKPPSLAEILAPLARLRDPGHPDFDELVGNNRVNDDDPQQGLDLRLTIDPNAQRIAQQVAACAVGQASGNVCAALKLDGYGKAFMGDSRARMLGIALIHLASGEIRALASAHSDCYAADFDLRPPSKDCAKHYNKALKPDALLNHALFNDYMPASTVKPIMALGFLADGVADVANLQHELARSDSVKFLDRLFYYERSHGTVRYSPRRAELIRDKTATLGWNTGCDPGGVDCGHFDPLFGRPTIRRNDAARPIGLDVLYGRFFVEPVDDSLRDMRLLADLTVDANKLKACADKQYEGCQGAVAALVSTGFGQGNARATALGVAGLMARLALAEQNQPAPWPHLLKDRKLRRIDGQDYETAASRDDFKADGRKLNATPPQDIDPAHAKIVLDGLRQGHVIGTSATAFKAAFASEGKNAERWRKLSIAGKTGTPSYKEEGHTRPLKWYAGLFGPAGGPFEYAIAVLGERNWTKAGGIDDPVETGSNLSAEIAFQVVKRLMPMPAADAPAAKPAIPGNPALVKPAAKPKAATPKPATTLKPVKPPATAHKTNKKTQP